MNLFIGDAKSRGNEVYQKSVKETFLFLKETTQFHEVLLKAIPFKNPDGYLLPVSKIHIKDNGLIEKLSQWREENSFAYPTQFPITFEGTKNWLQGKLLDVPDRILFLVCNEFGETVGHLGFASCLNDQKIMEIDNVIRGDKKMSPGIMSAAMKALLIWAQKELSPSQIFLRVFEDNNKAIKYYEKMGFVKEKLIPLRKHTDGSMTLYKPLEEGDKKPADKNFQKMILASTNSEIGNKMILTAGPLITSREKLYAADAASEGWNNQWSKYIRQFEEAFAKYLNVKYALATSSCTGALHLSLLGLGIGPGDEVIVPDITWVATANAVVYVGATPIFADVQPDTWCLDPHSVEKLITKKTKAIMPVHLYGHPAEMDALMSIAKKHGLYIIEDAAPSIGAEFKGQKTGTFGDVAAFSFQGAKLMVTGEGGMLVTNNEELYKKIYSLWDQGRTPGTFWIHETGWKYKMSNIQAALGLGQLEHVDALVEAKRRIFYWYANFLQDVPHIKLNFEASWARSIYWMSSLWLDQEKSGIGRDDFQKELKKRNIDSRPVFPAISQYPIWPKKQLAQPVAHKIGAESVNLPSGVCLTKEEIKYICECIRNILLKK